jgi:hypothetical protein
MKRALLSVITLLLLAGCSNRDMQEYGVQPLAKPAAAPVAALAQGKVAREPSASAYLAYEHSLQVDTEESKVAGIHEAAQAACRDAVGDHCVILESRIGTGQYASASLKFRAEAAGIEKIIAALNQHGEITNRSTTAEDLAAPIADTEKSLAMLKDYRTRLEALRGKASNDIDALIKVTHELAEVQSQIESAQGEHAHLLQRVQTQILQVQINSSSRPPFWRPINHAGSRFSAHLSEGIASVITATAYLLPWLLLLGIVVLLVRKLWRRLKNGKKPA